MNINVWEEIFRIVLSGILSGIIGFEREKHGREAGLRTMLLVGMGVTTILITSFNVYNVFSANTSSSILRVDPARIAYGVVTGIGFLGAGAIVKDKKRIRGLTTAACLWMVTSIGLAVGCGLYLISIFTTVFAVFVLYFLKLFEYRIFPDIYNTLIVVAEEKENTIEQFKEFIKNFKVKILSISFERDLESKISTFTFTLRYNKKETAEELNRKIAEFENVKKIIWK